MSRRLCKLLDLVDDADLIAAYEAHHRPGAVWPEVIADIRAQGVEEMEIWRSGDRLVMVMNVADDYPRACPAAPRVADWEATMARFQKAVPHTAVGEKWTPMVQIFSLADESAGA